MRHSTAFVVALVLSGAALFAMLFATQASVRAEPEAPQTTIIIDTCNETNFNSALYSANNGDVIHVRCSRIVVAVNRTSSRFSAQK